MRKIVDNPIRYNLLPLINEHYIEKNKLGTSPTSGLNTRIIRRFNTIVTLEHASNPNHIHTWAIEKFIEDKGVIYPECYIIETVNDKQYHLLSNRFDRPFIRGRLAEQLGTTSRRPIKYNEIMSDRIFKGMLPNFTQHLRDFDKEKTELFNAETFKEGVKRDITKKIEEKLALVKPIHYQEIFADRTIGSGVIGKVLYKELLPATKHGEFHVTYLKNIDNIITKYNMAINTELMKISVPPSYFVEKSDVDLRKYLVDSYMSAVNKAMEELDASIWIDLGASLKLFMMRRLLMKV